MKTPRTYVTKSHLLDYVTKGEFNEFRTEMYDFRDEVNRRFTVIDKRFDGIDRKLVDLDENMRRSFGLLHEQFREDLKASMEYYSNLDKTKVDRTEFDAVRLKINQRFFEGRTVV